MGQYDYLAGLNKNLRQWGRQAQHILFPPRSIATGQHLQGPGQIEPHIWAKLTFAGGPICHCCGQGLDPALHFDLVAEQTCAACMAHRPGFDRARAALIYDDLSRDIILRLKYGGDRSGLNLLARWMIAAAPDMVANSTLIVPIPLHYTRLVSRGFNQSLYLAAAISRLADKPLAAHAVKRLRATPTQAGKSANGRRRNVAGAFGVSRLGRGRLKDARIVLVDDVYTTGATVEAVTRILRQAGADRVDVLTLARVARPVDPTI